MRRPAATGRQAGRVLRGNHFPGLWVCAILGQDGKAMSRKIPHKIN